jgi:hypothetical protein
MEKRICWKKGMRLTDDIMRASEDATAARVGNALLLASAGRFGLIPSTRQFQLSLSIYNEVVEVQSLDCLAVTRDGSLIDVQFDTKFTNHLKNQVMMPDVGANELLLIISVDHRQWEETQDGYEEPVYVFSLVGINSPMPDNALPIAHLVYLEQDGGWHSDEEDFLPPCLFVSSHNNYENLLNEFVQKMSGIEEKVFRLLQPGAHEAFRVFWPMLQQILIDTDRGRDLMTPMMLLANIQKLVASFAAACQLDPYLNLSDAEAFWSYALAPCDYKNVYPMILQGIKYCFLINEKVDKIENKQPELPKRGAKPEVQRVEAPSIAEDQLYQNCRTSTISVSVINNAPGAMILYSTDGSMPTQPALANGKIRIKNNFNSLREPEPDQNIVVKLKAVLNDAESEVRSFTVKLHKDYNVWIKI